MPTVEDVVQADVCVVGAGIAGLNAVHVASKYLRRDQRIVLVERRDRVGGMWVDTYDHVRLHQPHPFFTAGDVPWTFGMPPEHLASKSEVLDHLRHCLDESRSRVQVVELLGHELESASETEDGVSITCRTGEGAPVSVLASRLINATGLDVEANRPLALSSDRVRSISPESSDLRRGPLADDAAPVWVVGSGKTGMDALHTLITHHPKREVNLLGGTGTFFGARELFYPKGWRRYFRGKRPADFLSQMADRFDGTNEAEVAAWARDTYGTWVTPRAEHFFLGMLSRVEAEEIRNGLNEVVMDHLVDAVDDGDRVRLTLRSGDHLGVPPGSWIVNCTSHLDLSTREPDPAYVSPSGRVLNVGVTPMFGFSSFGAYFLTHLMFLDKLTSVPLYTVDAVALFRHSTPAALSTAMTMAQYNLGLVLDNVPARVFQQCGLDFDRWYPLPRRLVGQMKFVARHQRQREHYRRTLDAVSERFGVTCGPLVTAAPTSVRAARASGRRSWQTRPRPGRPGPSALRSRGARPW